MPSILIYNYNNYYNREVKKEDGLDAYGSPIYIESGNSLNFNPGDGVTTTYTAGRSGNSYNGSGDYLIYSTDNVHITSRWFIIDQPRNCYGQYICNLHRDVIVDNYDDVLNAKALVQNATLADSDPLIYNQEQISTNQIKSSEVELKDDTGCAWIVGYVARNTASQNINIDTSIILPDIEVDSLQNWQYYKYNNQPLAQSTPTPYFDYIINTYQGVTGYRDFSRNDAVKDEMSSTSAYSVTSRNSFESYMNGKKAEIQAANKQYNKLYFTTTTNYSDYNALRGLSGRILKAGSDYYKINIITENKVLKLNITNNKSGDYMRTYMNNILSNAPNLSVYNDSSQVQIRYVWNYPTVTLTLEKLTYGSYTLTFPDETKRYHLKDAPYDMFAIPYSDAGTMTIGSLITNNNKSLAVAIAQGLASKLDAGLHDLQIVPYCPFTGYTVTLGEHVQILDTNEKRYTTIKKDTETVLFMIWCTASSGTKNITLNNPITYTNKKLSNQCDMYRLVSPNYNGQFEFNLARNNTPSLDTFNVDYTYIPYNPYIHINPYFSGLYGQDYNDARGLICGGDFSLARVTDQWTSYQLNNKNYQAIFDRQIQNMDINHKYDMISGIAGAAAGTLQTAAVGSIFGPAGAVVGGVSSALGGVADISIAEQRYKESKSYATDIFNMQLQNIQALPYSLARTTAFTANNKIFPILEYYTCTEQEKAVIANLIANQGMTVGSIDTIGGYIYNEWSYNNIHDRGFVRAKLIKIDIEDDTHMANTISEELQKGVYFK